MTQPSKHSSQPEAVPDTTVEVESELFNAIVNRADVRCEIKHPVDTSTIEIDEVADSKISYPWDPAAPASSDFFNYLDIDSSKTLQAFDESEIQQKADQFFNQLDQLWDSSVQTLLSRKFASVPQDVLSTIATSAEQIIRQGDNLIDQLANCVQSVLPQWNMEDLQVLARPMAYAMRGENKESPLMQRDWQTLSSTEQAKLSLAIARYAIDELKKVDK